MFIKQIVKKNTSSGKTFIHYRLVESYRIGEKNRHRTIHNLGDVPELENPQNRKTLANRIEEILSKQESIFPINPNLERLAQKFAAQIVDNQSIRQQQPAKQSGGVDYKTVDLNSLQSDNVREIGAEWMCKNVAEQLKIKEFLSQHGWNEKWARLAEISIISKAIIASSEHKTAQWLAINSGLLELYGLDYDQVNRHHLYQASTRLYQQKDQIEQHLSSRTQQLFDLQDKIILYDLTNTYFEGRKPYSTKAKYGKSKEKRSDALLFVLAVVVDIHGFIKYSKLYEGNMADSKTLQETIEHMKTNTSRVGKKRLVVIDAGIATEDNLKMLREKGYDYLCVSRSKLKDYQSQLDPDKLIKITDKAGHAIELQKVVHKDKADTFMYVRSQQKILKEASMDRKFTQRFEQGIQEIEQSLNKKGGTKKLEKVWERIGRVKQKYPRANKYFQVNVTHNDKVATKVTWERINPELEQDQGVYFIRTTLATKHENILWMIYNTLNEIESTFRVLKTDLNLRPVYHQKDLYSEAHLFLGLLAYQVVNTVRHQLKANNINYDWQNIIRIMNTQKIITTSLKGKEENYFIRHCSRPTPMALQIYKALEINSMPMPNKKSVVPH